MTGSKTSIEQVVAMLQQVGYRAVKPPLTIASVPFEFAAVLVGANRMPDLIVVIDTIEESEPRIRQKIDGLSRALDVVGSLRPLTAILVGPKPGSATIDALSRVCRVLPIGSPLEAASTPSLDDWLAVLLPLKLPAPAESVADPAGELARLLPNSIDGAVENKLNAAALAGPSSVERAFMELIVEPLRNVSDKPAKT